MIDARPDAAGSRIVVVPMTRPIARTAIEIGIVAAADENPALCVVRDLTDLGAVIEVGPDVDLPDQFRLTVDALTLAIDCAVVRRSGRVAIVTYVR